MHYAPTKCGGMDELIKRVNKVQNDGHACKLAKAIAIGEAVCKEWHGKEGMLVHENM
jgi:hypothetical protein